MTIDKKDYLLGKAVGVLEAVSNRLRQAGAYQLGEAAITLAKEIKKELGME